MRGRLTPAIIELGKKHFNREITQTELRLLPYIQFVMMNEQFLELYKINSDEREILALWKKEGRVEGGATGLSITKEFWDAMNEILFYSYVEGRESNSSVPVELTTQGEVSHTADVNPPTDGTEFDESDEFDGHGTEEFGGRR